MQKGNYYGMSEHLIFDTEGKMKYANAGLNAAFVRKFYGSSEVIKAKPRFCFWFPDTPSAEILTAPAQQLTRSGLFLRFCFIF